MIRVEPHGNITVLADRYDGRRLNSPNDLVYRSDGTLFFTDPPFGLPGVFDDPDKELPFSGVFAVRDGRVDAGHRRARGTERPRLLARRALPVRRQLGPRAQGRHALRARATIVSVTDAAVLFDMTGADGEDAIDGLKVDVAGNVYACGPAGSGSISPARRAPRHAAPARGAAQPRLGRRDGRTLYVTALTSVYRIRLQIPGIRPQ